MVANTNKNKLKKKQRQNLQDSLTCERQKRFEQISYLSLHYIATTVLILPILIKIERKIEYKRVVVRNYEKKRVPL